MAQVLCLGEALVDRLGPPGGDPATDRPFDDRLGGAPANVACALARLGTTSALLARLGRDAPGAAFAALLLDRGVDTRALQWDEGRPTRVVLVRREHSGERVFGGFAGNRGQGFADQVLDQGALRAPLAQLLPTAQWLQMGSLPLASPASGAALERAVELAVAAAVPVALDVNWRPRFWAVGPEEARNRLVPLLERVRLLKLAGEEADWLFGRLGVARRDPRAIAAALPQGPAVLISDGAAPVRWWMGGHTGELAPAPVPVVDTTGAGDAFLAGLLHRLCAEPGLLAGAEAARVRDAVAFACACGALVCQGAGAIDPQPDQAQVYAFLNEQAVSLREP
ncbi:carbohydrate kinase [Cyanobium sp. Morenito 9A2]|uniref:carbohydrate kinase family protein n=1 Tax=Cyanobium sp. Morenito 9A2 TaxID=2823718 RepID=UPI0020CF5916|nr:carbohydrate kinase [Cyanobium sp. Morenito 9A2]MCP9849489.1 carbohydrate kinase [Cyanobium sp. Morenito 9A2]